MQQPDGSQQTGFPAMSSSQDSGSSGNKAIDASFLAFNGNYVDPSVWSEFQARSILASQSSQWGQGLPIGMQQNQQAAPHQQTISPQQQQQTPMADNSTPNQLQQAQDQPLQPSQMASFLLNQQQQQEQQQSMAFNPSGGEEFNPEWLNALGNGGFDLNFTNIGNMYNPSATSSSKNSSPFPNAMGETEDTNNSSKQENQQQQQKQFQPQQQQSLVTSAQHQQTQQQQTIDVNSQPNSSAFGQSATNNATASISSAQSTHTIARAISSSGSPSISNAAAHASPNVGMMQPTNPLQGNRAAGMMGWGNFMSMPGGAAGIYATQQLAGENTNGPMQQQPQASPTPQAQAQVQAQAQAIMAGLGSQAMPVAAQHLAQLASGNKAAVQPALPRMSFTALQISQYKQIQQNIEMVKKDQTLPPTRKQQLLQNLEQARHTLLSIGQSQSVMQQQAQLQQMTLGRMPAQVSGQVTPSKAGTMLPNSTPFQQAGFPMGNAAIAALQQQQQQQLLQATAQLNAMQTTAPTARDIQQLNVLNEKLPLQKAYDHPAAHLTQEQFVKSLRDFLASKNITLRIPNMGKQPVNLYLVYLAVTRMGGYEKVTRERAWRQVAELTGIASMTANPIQSLRKHYQNILLPFEEAHFPAGEKKQQSIEQPTESQPVATSTHLGPTVVPQTNYLANADAANMNLAGVPSLPTTGFPMTNNSVVSNQLQPQMHGLSMAMSPPSSLMNQRMSPALSPSRRSSTHQVTKSTMSPPHNHAAPAGVVPNQQQPGISSSPVQVPALPKTTIPSPALKEDVTSNSSATPRKKPYVPKTRVIETYGGIDVKYFEKFDLKPQFPSINDLGAVDIHAITMSIKSGMKMEMATALNTLTVLTSARNILLPISRCGSLLDALLDIIGDYASAMGRLSTKKFKYPFEKTIPSYSELVEFSLEEQQTLQVPEERTGSERWLSLRDRAVCAMNILRNLSFMPDNQSYLGRHRKFLDRLIEALSIPIDDGKSNGDALEAKDEEYDDEEQDDEMAEEVGDDAEVGSNCSRRRKRKRARALDVLEMRKSVLVILSNIASNTLLHSLEVANIIVAVIHDMLGARNSHYSFVALEAFVKLSINHENRCLLAQIDMSRLEALVDAVLSTLLSEFFPSGRLVHPAMMTSTMLAHLETLLMCLYNMVELPEVSLSPPQPALPQLTPTPSPHTMTKLSTPSTPALMNSANPQYNRDRSPTPPTSTSTPAPGGVPSLQINDNPVAMQSLGSRMVRKPGLVGVLLRLCVALGCLANPNLMAACRRSVEILFALRRHHKEEGGFLEPHRALVLDALLHPTVDPAFLRDLTALSES
ncbi:uncharacterized protein VTP21DRAFT_2256 [Calcarisporiella thermophila]|uniref:uncharacterized protein n=1 Tax=Calcarisporiella thermophila TaxID=911321 RepID=UPI0037420D49